jgi:hypothetical protein
MKHFISSEERVMKKRKILAGAILAGSFGATSANAALKGQWIGDNYTAGNWSDSSGNNNTATAVGAPVATPLAFGTHKGVTLNGTSYFTVPNTASSLLGATSLTLAAAFNPTAPQTSSGGQFWQNAGLIGNEQGGSVNDWGMSIGTTGPTATPPLVTTGSFGVGNPADVTITSGAINLAAPHVLVATWKNTGVETLYLDGVQVATNTAVSTTPRDAVNTVAAFALGANLALANGDLKPFIGSIAELRVYDDTTVDPVALSNTLSSTYAPEPGSLALIGVGGLALLRRRRRAV